MYVYVQLATTLVLWYGGSLVYHRKLNPGTLVSIMLYALNLAMCFAFLSNVYGEFMQVCVIDEWNWNCLPASVSLKTVIKQGN